MSPKRGWSELGRPGKRDAGFSLTELLVAIAVAMILMAIGLPAFMRAYRTYQLSNAATQVADILRLARYEAIRLNHPVQCLIGPPDAAGNTYIWVDSIPNTSRDPTEKTILLGPSGHLIDGGGLPGAPGMLSTAVGSFATTPPSPILSGVSFDARGAVVVSLTTVTPLNKVAVFYLSSTLAPGAGYRSVLLMPAGGIQIWTADSAGSWQQQR